MDELMGWITALHLRAPQSTVVLVGTHVDEIPSANAVMADVEEMLKTKHEAWKKRRRKSGDAGLKVEPGVVLVSSSPTRSGLDSGVTDLLQRLESQEGTTSFIPPSWSLALVVLDALKYRVEPLDALACWQEQKPLDVPRDKLMWVEARTITDAWQKVQDELPDDEKAVDPSFAMESALKLR